MMNIVLTGLVAGLAVTVALLARDRNRYYTISNETIKELAILEKEYDSLEAEILEAGAEIMALEEDRDYWRDMAVEMTDRYIDEVMGDLPEPTVGENIFMNYEEQLESTDQERQEQIAFIREHTEWAINEAISWGEYLNIPLNEEQIAQLREEGLALAERMINDEEYIDYNHCELKDCIEQSITCIKADIRRR